MKGASRWLRSFILGLVAMGVVWVSLAGNQRSYPQRTVSLAPTWQEALRQYLQNRRPDFENQLRQAWQRRALSSRQPRVQELPLTEAPGNERHPVWAPDRRLIAFSTNSVDSNGNKRLDRNDGVGTRYRIWLMEPDGSNARPAIPENEIPPTVPKGDELYPSWFPDSGMLAFVISFGGVTDIYTVNLRRSPVEIIRRTFGLRGVKRIAVSPSGAEIAFEQNNQIYLLALDTGAIRQLTRDGVNRNPAYLPDGRILYESNLDPTTNLPGAYFHIWVMRGDGANKTPITSGNQNDTEPAPIFYTHPNSILGRPPHNYRVAFTSDRNGNRDIFITDESGTRIRQISVPGNRTQEFQSTVEPFPVEVLKIERVAFVTTRTGNEDIWLISSFDIFPPMLSDQFGNPILPKITPKINLPGDTVTLEAAVFDPESGVDKVYAIFKSADDPLFLWALHFEGFPAQGNPPNPGDQAAIAHEVDWFIVDFDPDTGQERGLVNHLELMYQASQGFDIDRYWQSIQPYAIELFDDGTHGDRRAGDGIYTRRIKLPNTPRDYFVDIIPFDKSGNFPSTYVVMAISEYYSMVMPTPDDHTRPDIQRTVRDNNIVLEANRWLNVIPSVGYDNIVGCTSKPFTAERHVLFVSDYGCGQKWTTARAVELGNFQVGLFLIRLPDGRRLMVGQNYPGIPTESYYFGDIWAASFVQPGNPQKGVLGRPFAPFPIADRVAVWRTLCRGPVPDEILFFYLPRPVADPVLGVTRLYADRAVLWHAPYTGSLWVDRGTLEDPVTQGKLKRFLDRGGRLCITSGQDLGWALTINGQVSNDFLTTYLKARFSRVVGGFYGDYSRDLITIYRAHRHKLVGSGLASGVHDWGQGFTFDEGRSAADGTLIDPDQERGGTAGGIELLGWSYPNWDSDRNPYDPPLNPDFSGAGCENALVMDTVDVVSGGFAFYTYTEGGTNAAIQTRDPAVDYRVVTFFFPFEALNVGFKDTTIGQVTFSEALGFKHTLMNYIMDFLRTGSITGKVVDTQGNPLEGFTVRAQIGSLSPNPIIFGGALTKRDGSYEIIGLNTGVYDLEVSVPGWTSRLLRTTCEGVNNYDNATPFVSALNDFTMTKLPPGAISGKVTELDGTTPIIGATVTAKIVADERGNPIVLPPGIPSTYTTTTKGDGSYRLEGLPNATYEVTASAPRHTSVTKTGIVVRAGEETTGVDFALPGEPGTIAGQVVDAQTGQGIAGAVVEVISAGTTIASATTDPQGNFTISNVPVGVYTVQATAPNYKPASVTGVQVQTAATTRITIPLARAQPGSISGRVTRSDGTPVGGVTVEVVQPATGEVVASGITEDRFTVVGGYQRNYLITNVPLGTYTVKVRALGYTSTPPERTGIMVQEATETQNVNFVLRAEHTFARGVQLISIPYTYTNTPINQLLGTDRIITWETNPNLTDPMTGYRGGRYVRFPVPPADAVYLGRGYFVRFDQATDFTQPGTPAPTDQPFALVLDNPGWWLIGTPFPFKVDWTRTRVTNRATNESLSLRDAVLRGWLRDTLFALNATATGYVTSLFMEPFKGYWVFVDAPQGVVLLIDNTPTRVEVTQSRSKTRLLPLADGRLTVGENGWVLPLRLMQNGEVVSTVQIGMSPNATNGVDALDLPMPPSLRQWVPDWVTFGSVLKSGRSEVVLYSDIRTPSARPQVWDLVVEVSQRDVPLSLSWDGLNERVPADVRLTLVDLDTGEARYMRTTTGFTFAPREGVKRLRIIAERRSGTGLRIVGLRAEPMRGGQLLARFTLTEPAQVEAHLRTLTGRLVATVLPRRFLSAGEQRIVWDGRSVSSGLPKGIYLLEVRAEGERGEQVRAVMSVRW